MILLRLLDFYLLLAFVWCIGSWIPQCRDQAWYRTLGMVIEPYVNLFRGLNLVYGGMDFSAMVGIFALQAFRAVIASVVMGGMR